MGGGSGLCLGQGVGGHGGGVCARKLWEGFWVQEGGSGLGQSEVHEGMWALGGGKGWGRGLGCSRGCGALALGGGTYLGWFPVGGPVGLGSTQAHQHLLPILS